MRYSSSALLAMAPQQTSSRPMTAPRAILGAVAGDIIGSIYENNPIKRSDFSPLLDPQCTVTDDTVLTVATMEALLERGNEDRRKYHYAQAYRKYGKRYPNAGYGGTFMKWIFKDDAPPYNSWGNGSAMRVSPIGWAFNDREKVLEEAKLSAEVTHNHPEGIKGAQVTALAVYLARTGMPKNDIKAEIEGTFQYDLSSRTIDDIRPQYTFDVSCQGSVPEAIICFLESDSVEQAIRLAVSLGGDSDTQACIAGSIAEAYYGSLDEEFAEQVRTCIPPDLLGVIDQFGQRFCEE